MTFKEFFSFKHNWFLWTNLILLTAAVFGGFYGALYWLDGYTHHGEAVEVPNVKGLLVEEAEAQFTSRGLVCVVSDSTYVKTLPAGSILDNTPPAGQRVKRGRTVYLTINTLAVPLQQVPDIADNSSLRQAEARLLATGFRLDSVEYMAGEKDWVYGVKYKGKELPGGAKVPMGSILTLMVGNGGDESLLNDSAYAAPEPVHEQTAADTDDSWF